MTYIKYLIYLKRNQQVLLLRIFCGLLMAQNVVFTRRDSLLWCELCGIRESPVQRLNWKPRLRLWFGP